MYNEWLLLCIPALHGHVPVVQLLLQKARYPVDQQDSCGSTPLMDALRAGYTQVADVLLEEHQVRNISLYHVDGLVQERRNSIADALELGLSCTNP